MGRSLRPSLRSTPCVTPILEKHLLHFWQPHLQSLCSSKISPLKGILSLSSLPFNTLPSPKIGSQNLSFHTPSLSSQVHLIGRLEKLTEVLTSAPTMWHIGPRQEFSRAAFPPIFLPPSFPFVVAKTPLLVLWPSMVCNMFALFVPFFLNAMLLQKRKKEKAHIHALYQKAPIFS